MFSAYNAATRTLDPKQAKKNIGELGSLVAGIAHVAWEKSVDEVKIMHQEIYANERSIRDKYRQVRLRENQLKIMESVPANIKRKTTCDAKKSVALRENLIDDLKIVENRIFITTTNLAFDKSQLKAHRHSFNLSNLDIGRFLIMINAAGFVNGSSIKSTIQICNLTWRVGSGGSFYHHPFIREGGRVCFGDSEPEFRRMLNNIDIIGVIDLILALLVTPDDRAAWISWAIYFNERGPIEQKLADGETYWRFENGPQSLERFYRNPKKNKAWRKAMKDAIGCGWVGMIQANNSASNASAFILSEVTNLFDLLNHKKPQEYKEKLAAMTKLAKNPPVTLDAQTPPPFGSDELMRQYAADTAPLLREALQSYRWNQPPTRPPEPSLRYLEDMTVISTPQRSNNE